MLAVAVAGSVLVRFAAAGREEGRPVAQRAYKCARVRAADVPGFRVVHDGPHSLESIADFADGPIVRDRNRYTVAGSQPQAPEWCPRWELCLHIPDKDLGGHTRRWCVAVGTAEGLSRAAFSVLRWPVKLDRSNQQALTKEPVHFS